jgi:hypothetical protein
MAGKDDDNAQAAQDAKDKAEKDKADAKSAADTRAAALAAAKADEGRGPAETRSRFVEAPPPANNFVNIGCKLPHGLELTLFRAQTAPDNTVKHIPLDGSITLKGRNSSNIVGGYGITQVPTEFWEAWVAANPHFKALKSGAIFAEPNRARALAHADAQRDLKTGAEPLNSDKPGPGLAKVPESEQRAAAGFQGA